MRLTLNLTHRCNLACSYCFAGRKFASTMDAATGRKAIDRALEADPAGLDLLFFGGEPLLAWDRLTELTSHARVRAREVGARLRLGVTTNGTLLDEERAAWLADEGFHVGLSVDGGPEAQDAARPRRGDQSSADSVHDALDLALETLPSLEVIAVVDPANVHLLDDSIGWLLDRGVDDLVLNPNWGGPWRDEHLGPWRTAYERAADRWVEAYREGAPFRLNVVDEPIRLHVQGGWHDGEGCGFDGGDWAVTPTGDLFPCGRAVGEGTDGAIRVGHLDDPEPDPRPSTPATPPPTPADCAACPLQDRCSSRCGCACREETGDPHEPGGVLCWHERMAIPIADRAAETLWAERNETFLARFYRGAIPAA